MCPETQWRLLMRPMSGTLLALALLTAPATAVAAPAAKPKAFAMCGVCHKVTPNAASAMGPGLWEVGGRKAGSVAGFAYSPALKSSKIVWTRDNLIAFVTNPKAKVPGTRMAFAGLKNPKDAAEVADYLLSLK